MTSLEGERGIGEKGVVGETSGCYEALFFIASVVVAKLHIYFLISNCINSKANEFRKPIISAF